MLGSTLVEFKVDYENNQHLAIGDGVHSDAIAVGGHMWRMNCCPFGVRERDKGEYVSFFLELLNKSSSVEAIFGAWLKGNGQDNSTSVTRTLAYAFYEDKDEQDESGWHRFCLQVEIEEFHLTDEGYITFVCAIMVLSERSIPVPPPDLGEHLGRLLDSADGTDVSFNVDGETFHAHRAVLAARSPVFRVGLHGSMAEAKMPSIALHDIVPAVFRTMLHFMYTDKLPVGDELGTSSFEMMQHLLAAADRYALDRLKLICAQRLWDKVSVDNVAAILACAEMYSCSELKSKCIDFFADEKNFKKSVLTEGFLELGQQFPSIIVELRERVGT
ncbi:hypothetical protein HU200_065789 [Digitaria exilis]|uniref:BTB domain-containing protein n=1 Tax=Digitaria exilis TaxID=1010633 RepID=A0A835DUL5_9POAL|nr:hypothetical protein HU200_065789 [Digitaria exilis]